MTCGMRYAVCGMREAGDRDRTAMASMAGVGSSSPTLASDVTNRSTTTAEALEIEARFSITRSALVWIVQGPDVLPLTPQRLNR